LKRVTSFLYPSLNGIGELSVEAASIYTGQLLLGLEYLHEIAFVCHRDMKPENVLLTEDRKV
jgi:serine/threonine protein kinase